MALGTRGGKRKKDSMHRRETKASPPKRRKKTLIENVEKGSGSSTTAQRNKSSVAHTSIRKDAPVTSKLPYGPSLSLSSTSSSMSSLQPKSESAGIGVSLFSSPSKPSPAPTRGGREDGKGGILPSSTSTLESPSASVSEGHTHADLSLPTYSKSRSLPGASSSRTIHDTSHMEEGEIPPPFRRSVPPGIAGRSVEDGNPTLDGLCSTPSLDSSSPLHSSRSESACMGAASTMWQGPCDGVPRVVLPDGERWSYATTSPPSVLVWGKKSIPSVRVMVRLQPPLKFTSNAYLNYKIQPAPREAGAVTVTPVGAVNSSPSSTGEGNISPAALLSSGSSLSMGPHPFPSNPLPLVSSPYDQGEEEERSTEMKKEGSASFVSGKEKQGQHSPHCMEFLSLLGDPSPFCLTSPPLACQSDDAASFSSEEEAIARCADPSSPQPPPSLPPLGPLSFPLSPPISPGSPSVDGAQGGGGGSSSFSEVSGGGAAGSRTGHWRQGGSISPDGKDRGFPLSARAAVTPEWKMAKARLKPSSLLCTPPSTLLTIAPPPLSSSPSSPLKLHPSSSFPSSDPVSFAVHGVLESHSGSSSHSGVIPSASTVAAGNDGEEQLRKKLVSPLIKRARRGRSSTVILCGFSGTGKTHTLRNLSLQLSQELFSCLHPLEGDVLEMTYVQIVGEHAYHLIGPSSSLMDQNGMPLPPPPASFHGCSLSEGEPSRGIDNRSPFCTTWNAGSFPYAFSEEETCFLPRVVVRSPHDIHTKLAQAEELKCTRSHALNARSSCSHCIFALRCTRCWKGAPLLSAVITVVDVAALPVEPSRGLHGSIKGENLSSTTTISSAHPRKSVASATFMLRSLVELFGCREGGEMGGREVWSIPTAHGGSGLPPSLALLGRYLTFIWSKDLHRPLNVDQKRRKKSVPRGKSERKRDENKKDGTVPGQIPHEADNVKGLEVAEDGNEEEEMLTVFLLSVSLAASSYHDTIPFLELGEKLCYLQKGMSPEMARLATLRSTSHSPSLPSGGPSSADERLAAPVYGGEPKGSSPMPDTHDLIPLSSTMEARSEKLNEVEVSTPPSQEEETRVGRYPFTSATTLARHGDLHSTAGSPHNAEPLSKSVFSSSFSSLVGKPGRVHYAQESTENAVSGVSRGKQGSVDPLLIPPNSLPCTSSVKTPREVFLQEHGVSPLLTGVEEMERTVLRLTKEISMVRKLRKIEEALRDTEPPFLPPCAMVSPSRNGQPDGAEHKLQGEKKGVTDEEEENGSESEGGEDAEEEPVDGAEAALSVSSRRHQQNVLAVKKGSERCTAAHGETRTASKRGSKKREEQKNTMTHSDCIAALKHKEGLLSSAKSFMERNILQTRERLQPKTGREWDPSEMGKERSQPGSNVPPVLLFGKRCFTPCQYQATQGDSIEKKNECTAEGMAKSGITGVSTTPSSARSGHGGVAGGEEGAPIVSSLFLRSREFVSSSVASGGLERVEMARGSSQDPSLLPSSPPLGLRMKENGSMPTSTTTTNSSYMIPASSSSVAREEGVPQHLPYLENGEHSSCMPHRVACFPPPSTSSLSSPNAGTLLQSDTNDLASGVVSTRSPPSSFLEERHRVHTLLRELQIHSPPQEGNHRSCAVGVLPSLTGKQETGVDPMAVPSPSFYWEFVARYLHRCEALLLAKDEQLQVLHHRLEASYHERETQINAWMKEKEIQVEMQKQLCDFCAWMEAMFEENTELLSDLEEMELALHRERAAKMISHELQARIHDSRQVDPRGMEELDRIVKEQRQQLSVLQAQLEAVEKDRDHTLHEKNEMARKLQETEGLLDGMWKLLTPQEKSQFMDCVSLMESSFPPTDTALSLPMPALPSRVTPRGTVAGTASQIFITTSISPTTFTEDDGNSIRNNNHLCRSGLHKVGLTEPLKGVAAASGSCFSSSSVETNNDTDTEKERRELVGREENSLLPRTEAAPPSSLSFNPPSVENVVDECTTDDSCALKKPQSSIPSRDQVALSFSIHHTLNTPNTSVNSSNDNKHTNDSSRLPDASFPLHPSRSGHDPSFGLSSFPLQQPDADPIHGEKEGGRRPKVPSSIASALIIDDHYHHVTSTVDGRATLRGDKDESSSELQHFHGKRTFFQMDHTSGKDGGKNEEPSVLPPLPSSPTHPVSPPVLTLAEHHEVLILRKDLKATRNRLAAHLDIAKEREVVVEQLEAKKEKMLRSLRIMEEKYSKAQKEFTQLLKYQHLLEDHLVEEKVNCYQQAQLLRVSTAKIEELIEEKREMETQIVSQDREIDRLTGLVGSLRQLHADEHRKVDVLQQSIKEAKIKQVQQDFLRERFYKNKFNELQAALATLGQTNQTGKRHGVANLHLRPGRNPRSTRMMYRNVNTMRHHGLTPFLPLSMEGGDVGER